jgi:3-phosphoshikimate 1-carboxyvinyltransferase
VNDLWNAPRANHPVTATITVPGSKSITNRVLVLGALAEQPITIVGALKSRDTTLMVSALQALGTGIEERGENWQVTSTHRLTGGQVNCGLAGTVMRFVPPLSCLADGPVYFDGDPRARQRPMQELLASLRTLGAKIEDEDSGVLPFTVLGTGGLPGGEVEIDASASSQFISGLLLSAPRFSNGVTIRHIGNRLPSSPHIAMTVAMLREAGVSVDDSAPFVWRVEPGPIRMSDYSVEPDLSTAAPFLGAALVTQGEVTVTGWPAETTQAGNALQQLVAEMGGKVKWSPSGLTVHGSGKINGIDADLSAVGELTPVIAALTTLATEPSQLRGIGHLRGHETDRLAALTRELSALGAQVSQTEDGLRIVPKPLHGGVFHTYHDHRMAQAGALLGLVVEGLQVENITTTSKTMPDFPQQWAHMVEEGH